MFKSWVKSVAKNAFKKGVSPLFLIMYNENLCETLNSVACELSEMGANLVCICRKESVLSCKIADFDGVFYLTAVESSAKITYWGNSHFLKSSSLPLIAKNCLIIHNRGTKRHKMCIKGQFTPLDFQSVYKFRIKGYY